MRVLAFEDQESGRVAVIANNFKYLAKRYSLDDAGTLRDHYETAIASTMAGIPVEAIAYFPYDEIAGTGLVTLDSPHDFATTEKRIVEVINASGYGAFRARGFHRTFKKARRHPPAHASDSVRWPWSGW